MDGESLRTMVDEVSEQVQFAVVDVSTQLGPRHNADALFFARSHGFVDAIHRIVVGQTQYTDTGNDGFFDCLRWRTQPVRAGRMGMEIGQVILHRFDR